MSPAARLLLCAALAAPGCAEERKQPAPVLPPQPRAAVVLEPPRLVVGGGAVVEVAVVTPPEHRVLPLALPDEVAGLEILEWSSEPVGRRGERWLHRTRIRVRARDAGRFEWPVLRVEIEKPEGEREVLETEVRPFRVASALEELPERDAPFPLRSAPERGRAGLLLAAAAGGALLVLAGLGAVVLVRRGTRARSRRLAPARAPGPPAPPPWSEARARLDAARAVVAADPGEAAHRGAHALRGYVGARFGLALAGLTTEELEARRAPLALATRWRALVAVLRALDAVRFRARGAAQEEERAAHEVREALDAAQRFVEQTLPPQAPT